MPDADRRARRRCATARSSSSPISCADTDTVRHARVKLPAAAWGEKDGTVTNSERRISRQRAFLPPPGEARPDWWIVTEVARRMGFARRVRLSLGRRRSSPSTPRCRRSRMTATRDFDIGAFAGIDRLSYDGMQPFQWPRPSRALRPRRASSRPAASTRPTARRASSQFARRAEARTMPPFPLVLNTGRVRDHWHTMTRTGRSARLSQHLAEPFAEIHPDDARRFGIADADIVRVESARGEVLVRALLTSRQSRGSVFVPMHWTDQFASSRAHRYARPRHRRSAFGPAGVEECADRHRPLRGGEIRLCRAQRTAGRARLALLGARQMRRRLPARARLRRWRPGLD